MNIRKLNTFLQQYDQLVDDELTHCWDAFHQDLYEPELPNVVAALASRQATLTKHFGLAPQCWNGDIAPLYLRVMADVHITLAWILAADSVARAQQFILYGLGQEKLEIAHHEAELTANGVNPDEDPMVQGRKAWLNSQRMEDFTNVNLGSMSGTNTRKMAEEAGIVDFYNYVYQPFSACVHSTWQHVGRYNVIQCSNPLHGMHYLPASLETEVDGSYFVLSAKYWDKTYRLLRVQSGDDSAVSGAYELAQVGPPLDEEAEEVETLESI